MLRKFLFSDFSSQCFVHVANCCNFFTLWQKINHTNTKLSVCFLWLTFCISATAFVLFSLFVKFFNFWMHRLKLYVRFAWTSRLSAMKISEDSNWWAFRSTFFFMIFWVRPWRDAHDVQTRSFWCVSEERRKNVGLLGNDGQQKFASPQGKPHDFVLWISLTNWFGLFSVLQGKASADKLGYPAKRWQNGS